MKKHRLGGRPMAASLLLVTALLCLGTLLPAQPNAALAAVMQEEPSAPAAEGGPSAQEAPEGVVEQPPSADAEPESALNLFQLIWDSRWFMLPIGLMSLIVVAVTVERSISMRNSRVMPQALIRELSAMQDGPGFDPRKAYRACQEYPSAAASVIKAMLMRVGRPQGEVERAAAEASQREADRMHGNVRWLRLAAAVTPLMGLFGTVWGMIRAFHDTTQMAAGQNKADYLAEGIYLALVTTLGGLAVAIPAVMLAHYFEGRIERIFHRIDEMLFHLTPQVERFEGRVRFAASGGEPSAPPAPPVMAPSSAAAGAAAPVGK